MHAEALTRGNLSRRPVLPFRDVYDERGERSARGLNEKSARAVTTIGTNINKAIENPPFCPFSLPRLKTDVTAT